MSDRQWPTTKIGTAWLTYDPDDGWSEHDNPSDAEREFGAIVDHLRGEASEGWHESADTAAWGIWIPIERLRLVATAWPDDDTEDGERCKDAGWDAFLSGNPEKVEPDAAAIDFCVRQEIAAFASMLERVEVLEAERDALRANLDKAHATIVSIAVACATIDCEDLVAEHTTPDDYDDLVGHVERVVEEGHELRAEVARLRPLRALLEHCEARGAVVSLSCVPDAQLRWLLATGGDGNSFRANGDIDAVITAACDRLGVDHG